MDLKEAEILGDAIAEHWYYASKGQALTDFLGPIHVDSVLDVGAGSGVFSRVLLDAGVADSALCVDPGYEKESEEHHGSRLIQFRRSGDGKNRDLVLMMDVIEHVDDDVGLIRSHAEAMSADGLMAITVPAFQALWSGHDEFLGHKRRYTLGQLEAVVRGAGLDVVCGRYFFALLLPLAVVQRFMGRLRGGVPASALSKQSRPVDAALRAINGFERATLFRFNRLAGLTAFCLARPRV